MQGNRRLLLTESRDREGAGAVTDTSYILAARSEHIAWLKSFCCTTKSPKKHFPHLGHGHELSLIPAIPKPSIQTKAAANAGEVE